MIGGLLKLTSLTEEEARTMLEELRWPNGIMCAHCGNTGAIKLGGTATRPGLYQCKRQKCRKQFTVTVGTIFEKTKIPLRTWVFAFHLMCSSKKSISALQLSRNLGINYKNAWFMCHRIRYAMRQAPLAGMMTGVVEVDETYVGGKTPNMHASRRNKIIESGEDNKVPVVALVQRDGSVRTKVMTRVTSANLYAFMTKHIDPSAHVMTDSFKAYGGAQALFKAHSTVNHLKKEYVRKGKRGGPLVTTNTVESFNSLAKRSIVGAYHHISEKHMQSYFDEFSFRWSHRKVSDTERTLEALRKAPGKRLVYKEAA